MKKLWITFGTKDFLKQLQEKNEKLIVMQELDGDAMAMMEGEEQHVLKEPREFEIVEGIGELKQYGYIVLNNIPVTPEGGPILEDKFRQRSGSIETQEGFEAFRILRPTRNHTYVILTQWKQVDDFLQWKNSQDFKHSHKKQEEKPSYVQGHSYVTQLDVLEP
ncbi:antibiotic biosynthesis monooxygenase family protein [Aquisalibacillus elongatus]|uniref:Heme-degrading monooxygenase HmoA n=1 Tax=Aquisalibacillus elongatus TaxID=485577 RepID=A0A3N5C203_9BACI|nr:antibiotic biosynthesis monooxygenase [Aquisalibacillus elongatus]RPF52035.1 heme-degrading monooxygenase HmoA [Aquisalibacillus elongatus]